ncbi:MAG: hypothetical protein AB8B78_08860 [Polaribacter sp.]
MTNKIILIYLQKMLSKTFKFLTFILVVATAIQSCKKEENTKKDIDITINSADWPKELDAVIAAPKNHKIILENDKVRVLEVTVLPGEIESIHHHKWPSVMHLTQSGHFINRDKNGTVILDSRKRTEQPVLPITFYKGPQAAHYVENLSDSITMKLLRVELKK